MRRLAGVRFDPERIEVHRLLRGAPVRRGRMLDVGCGDGRLTRRIAHAAGRVVGIDPDPAQIARAWEFTARLLRRRVFSLERSEIFWLRTYFRDLSALDRFLAREWTGTTLPAPARRAIVSQLSAHPGSRIIAADALRLNVLRKNAG